MNEFIEKITSGNGNILASGTLITFDDAPINFKLKGALEVSLNFKSDDTEKTSLKAESTENKRLRLDLYNFNDVLGSGSVLPLEIGTWEGKKLFISFRVYSLNDSNQRTIHYSFFQGHE